MTRLKNLIGQCLAILSLFVLVAGPVSADPRHDNRRWDGYHDNGRWHDDRWEHNNNRRRWDSWERRSYYREPTPVVIYNSNDPYVHVRCSGNSSILGTVIGGGAGGLIGNQFGHGGGRAAATIGGVIIGALIGNQIDRQDESCAAQALEYGRPNTQIVWEDEAGEAYVVRPIKTYRTQGRYCREYQTRITVGGRIQESYGTACRQPDGSWEVVN